MFSARERIPGGEHFDKNSTSQNYLEIKDKTDQKEENKDTSRISLLLDLLSEENMKYKKLLERSIILVKETKDLKTELDSLTELIRILQTEKSSSKVNVVKQTKDNSQEWKIQTKKNHNQRPPEPHPQIDIRNTYSILQDDDKENNTAMEKDNCLFSIQMENIKLKQKVNYLESRQKHNMNYSEKMKINSEKQTVNRKHKTRRLCR